MKVVNEKVWLTMKQVIAKTDIRAATINRYKEDFSDFIEYRYNASQMLEFNAECIPTLKRIFTLYRDTANGRMTTEKVRIALIKELNDAPDAIDLNDLTMSTPQNSEQQLAHIEPFVKYLSKQEKRLALVEEQNKKILTQQECLLLNQEVMKDTMNKHLSLLSEVARARMEDKKLSFWQKIFGGRKNSSSDQDQMIKNSW